MQKPKMYQSQLKKCSTVMPEKLESWLLLKLESITIRILLLAIWMWLCLNSLDLFFGRSRGCCQLLIISEAEATQIHVLRMIVQNDHLYPSALLTGSRAVPQSSWGQAAFQHL